LDNLVYVIVTYGEADKAGSLAGWQTGRLADWQTDGQTPTAQHQFTAGIVCLH
jgi:hypothetical protein